MYLVSFCSYANMILYIYLKLTFLSPFIRCDFDEKATTTRNVHLINLGRYTIHGPV